MSLSGRKTGHEGSFFRKRNEVLETVGGKWKICIIYENSML